MALILSCDIGTQTTYLVARDDNNDQLSHIQVPTDQTSPALSLNKALEQLKSPLETAIRFVLCGVPFNLYETYLHSFTDSHHAPSSNQKFALITNQGVSDILNLYNCFLTPTLLKTFPKEVRLELPCRLTARGEELIEPDKDHIRNLLQAHIDIIREQTNGICLSFMHSDLNNVHERDILELCYELWPDGLHLASHEVTKSGSFAERSFMAAATLAYQETIQGFFSRLCLDLKKNGFNGDLLLVGRQQSFNDGQYPFTFKKKKSASRALPRPDTKNTSHKIHPRLAALEIFGASQINMLQAASYHAASRSYGDCFILDIGATQSCLSHTRLMSHPARQTHSRINGFLRTSENEHALWQIPISDHRNFGAGSHIQLDHLDLYHFCPSAQTTEQRPEGISCLEAALLLGYLSESQNHVNSCHTYQNREKIKEILQKDISHPLSQDSLQTASEILNFAIEDFGQWAKNWVSLNQAGLSIDSFQHNPLICCGGFAPLIGAEIAKIIGCHKVIIPAKAPFLSSYWGQLAGLNRETDRQIMRPFSVITPDILSQIFDTLKYQHQLSIQAEQIREVHLLHKFSVTLLNQETQTTDCFWIEDLQHPYESLLRYIFPDQEDSFYRGNEYQDLLDKYILLSVSVASSHRLESTFLPPTQLEGSRHGLGPTPPPVETRDVMVNHRLLQIPVYHKQQFTQKMALIGPALIEDQGFCCFAPQDSHIEIAASGDIIMTLSHNLS